MEMPDAVKWLLPIVVGQSWPEGDETKLRELGDAWHTAAEAVAPATDAGDQAVSAAVTAWTGESAEAFEELWKKFAEGDEAYPKSLAEAANALGDLCDQTALDVEYTKYLIIASLLILLAQIVAMIAAAFGTFGASTAGIPVAQALTRTAIEAMVKELLAKLVEMGHKQVVKKVLQRVPAEVLENAGMNLGKTEDAAVSGAVGHAKEVGGAIGRHDADLNRATAALPDTPGTRDTPDIAHAAPPLSAGSPAPSGGPPAGAAGRAPTGEQPGGPPPQNAPRSAGPQGFGPRSGPVGFVPPSGGFTAPPQHPPGGPPPGGIPGAPPPGGRAPSGPGRPPPGFDPRRQDAPGGRPPQGHGRPGHGGPQGPQRPGPNAQGQRRPGQGQHAPNQGQLPPRQAGPRPPAPGGHCPPEGPATPARGPRPPGFPRPGQDFPGRQQPQGQRQPGPDRPGGPPRHGQPHGPGGRPPAPPPAGQRPPGGGFPPPGPRQGRPLPPEPGRPPAGSPPGPARPPGHQPGPRRPDGGRPGQPPRPEGPHREPEAPAEPPESTEHQQGEPPSTKDETGPPPAGEHSGREFRTDRRADFDALGEIQLDTGQIGDHGELRHEEVRRDALELRARDPRYGHMSDDGAYAVHSYTRHEVFRGVNAALRTGFGLPALAKQVRAIVSGLTELPPFEGEVVRTVNHNGDHGRAAVTAAHYEPGKTVVESQFSSTSQVTAEDRDSAFEGEVELRIRSKTGRDISGIASVRDEREVLLKPGTQLHVHSRELVTLPDGREKWVVHAEEVLHGDPRHLGQEAADQHVQERRERQAADDRRPAKSVASALGPAGMAEQRQKTNADIERENREEAAAAEERKAEYHRTHEPEGGWAELNRATTPPGEPAIHDGTARSPEQQVRFLREHLPEVANVNAHNYYAPDARENGFHGNDADAVVALEEGFQGRPRAASPALPDDVGSLDSVRQKLGGRWAEHPDFGSAIREIGAWPVGSRGVLAFQAAAGEPNRMVTVAHTEHGVAIVDPTANRLAALPEGHAKVQLLPYHREGGLPESDAAPHREPEITERAHEGPVAEPEHHPEPEPEPRATAADHDAIRRSMEDADAFDRLHREALAARDRSEKLQHVSDEAATALRAFTTHDLAYDLNDAHRSGAPEGMRERQARALAAALDEVPGVTARTVRGIDHHGDARLAELTADQYVPGRVNVETSFSGATIEDEGVEAPKFGYDVEIHVGSKNVKDISALARNPEREGLSKPGTQLFVHSKELVDLPGGGKKWVIHAEEVLPGDPRHLDQDTAKQQMAERRARYAETAHQYAESGSTRFADLLGSDGRNAGRQVAEPVHGGAAITDRLAGFDADPVARPEPEPPARAPEAAEHHRAPADLGPEPAPDAELVARHDVLAEEPTTRHDDEDLGPAPREDPPTELAWSGRDEEQEWDDRKAAEEGTGN
ncbi:ADP-ribosyltransferase [Amycolatopsis minnesotensis]